jgi:pimeloyl-ACP methyl ester carboxylesterase
VPKLLAWCLAALVSLAHPMGALAESGDIRQVEGFTSYSEFPDNARWDRLVPAVRRISIRSSADGSAQAALYYDSGSDRRKPLLVALHSWSFGYNQATSIPYALWAVQNDWVFIHPDHRGRYNRPEATASELAISDILDALDYALSNARVDPSRVYLAGFSGGAMTALVLAGRYPHLWTAVSAWVPIYNLGEWYAYIVRNDPKRHYVRDISRSCGGPPWPGSSAAAECDRRSPSAYLENLRNSPLKIYLAAGIHDDLVPPDHSLRVFNTLVPEEERLPLDGFELILSVEEPKNDFNSQLFEEAGAPLLFKKESDNVTLTLFDGGHDLLFNPALYWLSRQRGLADENEEEKEIAEK